MQKKLIAPLALGTSALLLSGCSSLGLGGGGSGGPDTRYVARDVNTLYMAAKEKLDKGQYQIAAALFDEVERQHPYSPWARRAQLMSAFSYYMAQKYNESTSSARRFLSISAWRRFCSSSFFLSSNCRWRSAWASRSRS